MRKAFPEHWSFLLGELALYSLVLLVLTGVWLTLFFQPGMREVAYSGSYAPLRGVLMSEAFDSTLRISFDIRGGLLLRQAHHWAALVFVAAIGAHLLRIFFTGAFRRPREINWVIGVTLFALAIAEGFAGYSLPDDLLSGTGLRIAQAIVLSLPVIGTYASFFVFGGQFPGHEIIPRLYSLHILLLPGVLIGLVVVHLILVFYLKHTQWRGPGRGGRNVRGKPLFPQFTASSLGLQFTVFGVLVLLAGIAQINPVWTYGPYQPDQASTGSQPDWYVGFLEGSLRLMPAWETNVAGHTIMWNAFLPAVVLPGLLFAVLYAYPFAEQWLTGEWHQEQHLCDRPRERPVRTGLGVSGLVFYGVLLLEGGNDVIAAAFRVSVNTITWVLRIALVLAPVAAFLVTRALCHALLAREQEVLAEGEETGEVRQSIAGGYESDHRAVGSRRPGAPAAPVVTRPGARTGTPSPPPPAPAPRDR
ncbi:MULTISPECIES: ubiquinol-cytochrome c reductase cytochrome b subunit [unclassified Streptomyces]|uniref:cytochrome bc1 complex cytochrome b subunit n=1 Tax=unclassified Streptomyces TaxID=2593676 RepID=UPI001CD2A934|nr:MULTISPECIES: ubiquinol-cytochrome c reductase cytochrome b subunit [unclassified Streptomyces]